MEPKMLLRDPDIFPSEEVLENVLGESIYHVLASFLETITDEEYALVIEWRFYNDGKAWFGKVLYKKKTVLWLSVWEGYFKTSFYFTEKHLEKIAALDIAKTVKDEFAITKPAGRLLPMIFNISSQEQVKDLLTVVRFKKSLV
ncbi:DUF3788 family protein [uncultured Dysgonomonas sp.]|uniref:YdhG-like domain-containing protein n=1 Tax=uncultured Dysgonomonas sp. TaxID=206096 RepID=A0A212K2E9_9BACT|nr:DUF3788 family protein [uncultured Dysgonomonas sp.]SBW05822.1 conserved hypothetical protein [uncultured Dysgonomonas sp.]